MMGDMANRDSHGSTGTHPAKKPPAQPVAAGANPSGPLVFAKSRELNELLLS
jgi:hypothetical protein